MLKGTLRKNMSLHPLGLYVQFFFNRFLCVKLLSMFLTCYGHYIITCNTFLSPTMHLAVQSCNYTLTFLFHRLHNLPFCFPYRQLSLLPASDPSRTEGDEIASLWKLGMEITSKTTGEQIFRLKGFVPIDELVRLGETFPKFPTIIRNSFDVLYKDPDDKLSQFTRLGSIPFDPVVFDNYFLTKLGFTGKKGACPAFPSSSCWSDCRVKDTAFKVCPTPDAVKPADDALVQRGCWFTPAHIELGGAATLSTLACGGVKLWFFGITQRSTHYMLRCATDLQWIHSLLARSSLASDNASIGYVVQTVGDTVCIPPTVAHTVVTFPYQLSPQSPSILVGCTYQLTRFLDDQKGMPFVVHFTQTFSSGVAHGTFPLKRDVRRITQEELDKNREFDHLIFLDETGFSMPTMRFSASLSPEPGRMLKKTKRARQTLGHYAVPKKGGQRDRFLELHPPKAVQKTVPAVESNAGTRPMTRSQVKPVTLHASTSQ